MTGSLPASILPLQPEIIGMTLETKRKRLLFRSMHRGTHEMDQLMGRFAERYLTEFSESQLNCYEEILNFCEPDLFDYLSGQKELPPELRNDVVDLLVQSCREKRIPPSLGQNSRL